MSMHSNVGPLGQGAVAQSQMVAAADVSGLPTGSILWADHANEFWVVVPGGVAPISLLAERAGRPPPDGEPAIGMAPEFALVREGDGRVPTHGTAQRHVIAWVQKAQRAHPNPAHLSLDGKFSGGLVNPAHLNLDGTFSFGVGTKDERRMSSNSGYGLTEAEVDEAASRIAHSADWLDRWDQVHARRRSGGGYDLDRLMTLIGDACGAPTQNIEPVDIVRVEQAINRIRFGGDMRQNAGRRRRGAVSSGPVGPVVVTTVLYRGIWAVPVRLEVRSQPGPAMVQFSYEEKRARETHVRLMSALVQLGSPLDATVTVHVDQSAVAGAAGYAGLDLPIALGMLALKGHVPRESLLGTMAVGELALDGSLRPIRGAAVAAVGANVDDETELLLVPAENEVEARFLAQKPVMSFGNLSEVLSYMQTREIPHEPPIEFKPCKAGHEAQDPGLPPEAVHAAQRGQNLLLVGPPGAGKMMAARYIHSTLAGLSVADAKELTEIYSVAGLLQNNYACARPFRAPHHSVSQAGLIGGGEVPRPGEATLATFGVLLLDELPEFKRESLRWLAQSIQSGRVVHHVRGAEDIAFPAHPLVVIGTANPCPCGHFGTSRCRCSTLAVASYEERLREVQSFFAMLRVELQPLTVAEMIGGTMLRNAKGDIIWQDNLLTWKSVGEDRSGQPRGIEMIASAEGRVRAQDMLEERQSPHFRSSPLSQEIDFLEVALGNGWSTVPPEDIGALTDATIVSQDGFIGDDGKWYPHPEVEAPIVYAHMNYAVEDPVEMWAEGEPVFWMADVLTVNAEQRTRAREELSGATGEAYESNARKNVTSVINAFLAGRRHSEKTCSTDGWRLYSYALLIASRVDAKGEPVDVGAPGARVVVLDKRLSPSATTSTQINAVLAAVSGAQVVDDMPYAARYLPNADQKPNARKGQFKAPASLSQAEKFFFESSGYSYPSGANSTEQKRARVEQAKALAAAEAEAQDRGWTYEWDYDQEADTSWMDEEALEEFRSGQTEMLDVLLKDEKGNVLASLGGVHVSARGRRDPYVRVVEAELAQEALEAERSAGTAMALNGTDEELIDEGESIRSHAPGHETLSLTTLSLGVPRRRRRVYAFRMGVDERGVAMGGLHWVPADKPETAERDWFEHTGRRISLRGSKRSAAHSPNRVFKHMDLAGIEQILGPEEIARVLAGDSPAADARAHASKWWEANELERHDAYTNLARMLKAGVLDDLVAEARGAR